MPSGPGVRRDVVDLDSMERTSMACPAMPLCGLAVTEAERSLPDMLPRLRALLNGMGLEDLDSLVVRMTGARRARVRSAPN
jgi:sulfite reductase (ferredoxin)